MNRLVDRLQDVFSRWRGLTITLFLTATAFLGYSASNIGIDAGFSHGPGPVYKFWSVKPELGDDTKFGITLVAEFNFFAQDLHDIEAFVGRIAFRMTANGDMANAELVDKPGFQNRQCVGIGAHLFVGLAGND